MPTLNTLGAVLERVRLDERRNRRTRRRLRDRKPKHLRPRRAKCFDTGRTTPLDRNAKARIECRMRVLTKRTEARKHYGPLTGKAYKVGKALLFDFHNSRNGRCFPSYEAIAAAADCHRSSVAEFIAALEDNGILTWDNRIRHVWEEEIGLFGKRLRKRVVRTSNEYRFIDPMVASKSPTVFGTPITIGDRSSLASAKAVPDPNSPLEQALAKWGRAVRQDSVTTEGTGG
jgi:hypothetical protein